MTVESCHLKSNHTDIKRDIPARTNFKAKPVCHKLVSAEISPEKICF